MSKNLNFYHLLNTYMYLKSPYSPKADASAQSKKSRPPVKFQKMHAASSKRGKRPVGVLFLGDSITEGWSNPAAPPTSGKSSTAPCHPQLRHRRRPDAARDLAIEHGELDGLHPKVVVFMLGTNNSADNNRRRESPPPTKKSSG